MTVSNAIVEADNLKPNSYPAEVKIKWLSRLDQLVKREVIDTHERSEGEEEPTFTEYGTEDLETELLVPEPYAELYVHWLAAQIDYYNREYNEYNNSAAAFKNVYEQYQREYNRTHMPKGGQKRYF